MQVPDTHTTERSGVVAVNYVAVNKFGWLFREQPTSDVGIDAHLEVVDARVATGRLLAVQIKSGPSQFTRPSAGGWWFPCKDDHVQYWLGHSLPVLVMLYDPDSEVVYWEHVSGDTVVSTGQGWKIFIPRAQRFGADSARPLAAVARPQSQSDPFLAAVERLPGEARARLLRARATDDAYTTELAVLLADAADPAAVVRGLLYTPPAWLAALPEAGQESAWQSIAAYAAAHDLQAVAVDALERAAAASAASSRWQALAATLAAAYARDRARPLIAAARPGHPILAAIAGAILTASEHAPQVPDAVEQALAAADPAVVGDPAVLRFLAHARLRAGREEEALTLFEQALRLAPDQPVLQVDVAQALLRRSAVGAPTLSFLDEHRAERLARVARSEYRRWRGPSEQAAQVLLRARLMTHDVAAAVRTGQSAPDGEADAREGAHEPLLLETARVARQAGLAEVADRLTAALTDPGALAQLAAVTAASDPAADRHMVIAAWQCAAAQAVDEEQQLTAALALTDLGVWPVPVLDQLRNQGLVAEALYAVQQATAEVACGNRAAALRQLRQWEAGSAAAAVQLVRLHEDAEEFATAAEVAERAGVRYGDLKFRLQAVRLWERAGRPDQARLLALTLLSHTWLSPQVRQELRATLVDWAHDRRDWQDMEDHAMAGLAEALALDALPDTATAPEMPSAPSEISISFVWAAIIAQHNARRLDAAWHALTRFAPPVRQPHEARIWLALTDHVGWTEPRADQALTLAERFADDPTVRDRALACLVHATGGPSSTPSEPEGDTMPPPGRSRAVLQLSEPLAARFQALLDARPPLDSDILRAGPRSPEAFAHQVRQTLGPRQPLLDALRDAVRLGTVPMAFLAQAAERPLTLVYLQRGAGLIPAATLDRQALAREIGAARSALDGSVAIDPGAIAVATLIPGRFDHLRACFTTVHLPAPAFDDIINTHYAVDTLVRSSGTLGIHGEHLVLTRLSPEEKRYLARRAASVSQATQVLAVTASGPVDPVRALLLGVEEADTPEAPDAAWLAALQYAHHTRTPLWCDDVVLRRMAHQAGIPAFGTVALLHVLTKHTSYADFTEARLREDLRALLEGYVVDLPVDAEFLTDQAQADGWQPKSAAAPFARPQLWILPTAETYWCTLAAAIWEHAPEHLGAWCLMAAHGVTGVAAVDQVPARLAHLMALTLVRGTGIGPEPVQAVWESFTQALSACTHAAARRLAGLALEGQPPAAEVMDTAGFRDLAQQAVRALLRSAPSGGFSEAMTDGIVNAAFTSEPNEGDIQHRD